MLQTAASEEDGGAAEVTSPESDGEPNLPPPAEGDSFDSNKMPSADEYEDLRMDRPIAAADPGTETAEDDRSRRD